MLTEKERKRRQTVKEKGEKQKQLLREKDRKRKLQQREKEKKKNQIFRAAIKLFSEKGFDATMISDITRKAKVAYGTFYTFFEKKEDVVHHFFDLEMEKAHAQIERTLGSVDTFPGQIDLLYSTFWKHMCRNKEFIRIVVKDRILKWGINGNINEKKFSELFRHTVAEAKKRNTLDSRIDTDRCVKVAAALNTMYLIFWLNGKIKSRKECLEQLKEDMKIIFSL